MRKFSIFYWGIILFFTILTVSLFLPPFLIFSGNEAGASFLYNLHSADHQWIYRSQCIFKTQSGNLILDDCIPKGKESVSNISTLYTKSGDPRFNGILSSYDANEQIGINKAEKVARDGMVGYKFANDVRDYSIYIPLILAMLLYPHIFKNKNYFPHPIYLIFAITPLAIDGVFQLFGFWESTNLVRMITGAIAGFGAGIFIVAILNRKFGDVKNEKLGKNSATRHKK